MNASLVHIQARREDDAGRPAAAKQKAKIVLGLNIGAIVIHLVLVPVGVVFAVVAASDIASTSYVQPYIPNVPSYTTSNTPSHIMTYPTNPPTSHLFYCTYCSYYVYSCTYSYSYYSVYYTDSYSFYQCV